MNTCLIGTADGLDTSIEYQLLTEKSEDGADRYGILIRMGTEEESISDISSSLPETQNLMELMAAGAVTPIAAREIVEDWLLR